MTAPITLAALDEALSLGLLPSMTEDALHGAIHSVTSAFDPLWISGHEAHRCDVDRGELTDGRLREIEAAAWAVLADRNEMRWAMAA